MVIKAYFFNATASFVSLETIWLLLRFGFGCVCLPSLEKNIRHLTGKRQRSFENSFARTLGTCLVLQKLYCCCASFQVRKKWLLRTISCTSGVEEKRDNFSWALSTFFAQQANCELREFFSMFFFNIQSIAQCLQYVLYHSFTTKPSQFLHLCSIKQMTPLVRLLNKLLSKPQKTF